MKPSVAGSETFDADLPDLRAFCMVADLGSITAAARALGETKGTVSRAARRASSAPSAWCCCRRSPRLVQATEDGLTYRLRIGRALELVDDANNTVQRARATPSGHLRVTAPLDLGVSIVAPLMAGFVERYPGHLGGDDSLAGVARLRFESNRRRPPRHPHHARFVAHRLQAQGARYPALCFSFVSPQARGLEASRRHRAVIDFSSFAPRAVTRC